jgi:hypothetical protein
MIKIDIIGLRKKSQKRRGVMECMNSGKQNSEMRQRRLLKALLKAYINNGKMVNTDIPS